MDMQTDRILLRPWQESDAEALYKYASEPIVGERAGWPPHQSIEESREIIRTVFNTPTTWAIVLKETNEAIGAIGYMPDCPLNLPAREGEAMEQREQNDACIDSAESRERKTERQPLVGYWVGKPYWNQGICTEALMLMLKYIRKETSYSSLIGSHFIDNPASGRVMEKCGFIATGETAVDESLYSSDKRTMRVLRLELQQSTMNIRLEQPEDYREVESLTREAFWNVYAPGCVEHYVLNQYRSNPDFIPELDFVMESPLPTSPVLAQASVAHTGRRARGGEESHPKIIGHVMFSKAEIIKDDGTILPAWTFGPISIHPDYKRKGYGLKLLQHALEKAREMGIGVICMEGNIDFYMHAGFVVASTLGIHYHAEPKEAEVPYFLAQELIPGYLNGVEGTYHTPKGYYVAFENPEAFEAYEATFPPKEKKQQDGQLH